MTNNAGNIISNSQVIFTDDFRSEYDTRVRKGGVPTNVTYNADGTITLDGTANSNYPKQLKGTYTVKIKFNVSSFGGNYFLLDARGSNNDGVGVLYIQATTGTIIGAGTKYINGSASSQVVIGDNELMVTGIPITVGTGANKFLIGSAYSGSNFFTGTMDSVTVYEGTWTSQQVANDYNKKTYQALTPMSEQLGGELVDQDNWYKAAYWTNRFQASWSEDLVNTRLNSNGSGDVGRNTFFTLGKSYRVTETHTRSAGAFYAPYDGAVLSASSIISETKSYLITPTTTTMYMTGISFVGSVTALSIKEVLHPSISILSNLRMTDGEVKDDYNTVTNTDVSIVQAGGKTAGLFNGSSKLDLGTLIGSKTNILAMGWSNFNKYTAASNYILSDGKFLLTGYNSAGNQTMYFTANGLATAEKYSAANSFPLNKWNFFAIVSYSGFCTFYIGYIDTPPAVSNGLNQVIGVPQTGTTLYVGNNAASSRGSNGLISDIHIEEFGSYDETALKARLTQYWSLTRKNK